MKHRLCREKYRLELHWEGVSYHTDQVARLEGAFFSGPVLKNALRLEAPDFIDMDLTPQLLTLLDGYYIIRLDWQGVKYSEDGSKIHLAGATLTNTVLKEFHKIEDSDHIVIDTEKHEEKTHAFHLVYDSTLVRSDSEPYKYEKV
jgi:hypothetical protein